MIERILVINDEPIECNNLRKELKNNGVEVICVSSVYEALQAFLNNDF